MSIGALAALPVIGQVAQAAGDITKSIAPLLQPFADVLAKSLGNALDSKDKSIEFSEPKETQKNSITYN
ncbi:hypothetical protein AO262_04740 [Pseudomonas fluorescens ABAC62]|nr:hypothetical protein AO262_04740 [Pseudomonas fluorescens ABAC62]